MGKRVRVRDYFHMVSPSRHVIEGTWLSKIDTMSFNDDSWVMIEWIGASNDMLPLIYIYVFISCLCSKLSGIGEKGYF